MARSVKTSKTSGRLEKGRMKNIRAYKSLNYSARSKGWVSRIPSAAVRSNVKIIIHYIGVGRVEVPGSFLAEVSAITNLPVTHLAAVLDMSKTSYYRAQKEEKLAMETVDKLSSLFKIYQKGIEAFEKQEAFEEWVNSKVANLGNQKPIELIKS